MKSILALLAATTALGTLFSVAMLDGAQAGNRNAALNAAQHSLTLLVSGDDDADRKDECEDDEDDAEDDCLPAQNAAPSGAVAPPANGLFGNGTPPKAQVN